MLRLLVSVVISMAVVAAEDAHGDGRTLSAKRGDASPTLPMTHPRLQTDRAVEQVHITATDSVMINFVTLHSQPSVVEFRQTSCNAQDPLGRRQLDDLCNDEQSEEQTGTDGHDSMGDHAWQKATGTAHQYSALNYYTPMDAQGHPIFDKAWWGRWDDPKDWYTSGFCHAVQLPHLKPGALYSYRIPPMQDTHYYFRAPKAVKADTTTRIGVIGDMGQTKDSLQSMDRVWNQLRSAASLDQILLLGDLSYADGFGPRWDTYGRMVEPLFSHVPSSVVAGNHEFAQGEAFVGLRARWPMPPPQHGSSGDAGVVNPLFYSYEVGPVHVLALCSYMDSAPYSPMHSFVKKDLGALDRSKTPWLVVMMHVPMYTSNSNHKMTTPESTAVRDNLEPLFLQAGVDLVLAGHVHAYERTFHVGRGARLDRCHGGIVHVTIGDGGNREGVALPWLDPQPAWSAMREASFGYGIFEVESPTKARLEWWRDDGDQHAPAESVVLERGKCGEHSLVGEAQAITLE